jgi:glycosyltransferase involved in cell wall biosynthesis
MRILLISFYFPPYNNIGSVRVGKLAKYFTQLGHEVRVITACDSLFPKALTLEIPEENVRYTKWVNVRRPAEIIAGRSVGNGAADTNSYAAPRRSLSSWLWSLYRSLLYVPDMQIGWYPYARRAAADVTREWQPDLIYASAVPHTALLVASSLSRKLKIPWFAELRDLWVDNHFYSFKGLRRYLEIKLERRVLGSAAGIITVSEPLAETLRLKFKQPVLVATNGFDPCDFPAPAIPSGKKLRFV